MIQATNNSNSITKALSGANGKAAAKDAVGVDGNAIDPESMLENAEFASELAASLSLEDGLQPQPVQVDGKQLQDASGLIKLPDAGHPDSVNPKVFDPALTQGVDNLIQPETTKVNPELVPGKMQVSGQIQMPQMQMVDGVPAEAIQAQEVDPEIAQAMLKTPQVQAQGRAPAIDFAQSEVDPQLMNMEDFVAQKNLVAKKSVNTSAYGMHKAPAHKMAMESGLKHTQIVSEAGSSAASDAGASMNSQQFILGLSAGENGAKLENNAHAPQVKTFDMSQIKTNNPDQIMNQVADYIVQAKAAKEPTVNMRVNHEELGMIDITVSKTMAAGTTPESIAVNIGAHSADGKNFFQMNSKDLFSHLTSAGLNVSEVKVETPGQSAKNDFDMNGQSRGGQGGDKQYNSESNQRRQESERRQDLWDLLKDKEAA